MWDSGIRCIILFWRIADNYIKGIIWREDIRIRLDYIWEKGGGIL